MRITKVKKHYIPLSL